MTVAGRRGEEELAVGCLCEGGIAAETVQGLGRGVVSSSGEAVGELQGDSGRWVLLADVLAGGYLGRQSWPAGLQATSREREERNGQLGYSNGWPG